VKILGLTGDIAAGKSTVAGMLAARGARHLDADLGALLNTPALAQAKRAARSPVKRAAQQVAVNKFWKQADAEKLLQLEAIVHPAVAQLREEQLEALRREGAKWVVIEAVKLLESGQGQACDEIWCLTTWHRTQVERLMEKRNLSRDEALARLEAQPSPEAKRVLAGAVPLLFLPNNGPLATLQTRVDKEWARFIAD